MSAIQTSVCETRRAVETRVDNICPNCPPNIYHPEIISIELVGDYSSEDGAYNTYRITQNTGEKFDFFVKNGTTGPQGEMPRELQEPLTEAEVVLLLNL